VRVRERRERRHSQNQDRNRCHCLLEGINVQLTTVDDELLQAGSPVIFNEILTDNSRFMSYDHETGVIEIFSCGNYLIDWSVATVGSKKECSVSFGVEVNEEVKASSTLPTSVGQLSGQALICVDHTQTRIRLINTTDEEVQLSKFTLIANLRIVAVE